MKGLLIFLSIFLFTPSSVLAGTVTIPHTFTAGQPAVASQVNENFAAVKSVVDGNAAMTVVVKDGNGVEIGAMLGVTYNENARDLYTILSPKNYILTIQQGGTVHRPIGSFLMIYYPELNCQGTPHIDSISPNPPFWLEQRVYRSGSQLWYFDSSVSVQTVSYSSTRAAYSCSNETFPPSNQPNTRALTPNDPSVTGFQNSYPGPLSIKVIQ